MEQHGMRQVGKKDHDGLPSVGRETANLVVGAMTDPRCDVHFMKNRCRISKDDGKELDMMPSGGVFFVAARPSKSTSKEQER